MGEGGGNLQLDDGVVMGGHRLPQLRRTHGELCDLGPVVVTGRGGCLAPAGASHRLVRIADEAAAVVVATIVVGPGSLWKLLAQYLRECARTQRRAFRPVT